MCMDLTECVTTVLLCGLPMAMCRAHMRWCQNTHHALALFTPNVTFMEFFFSLYALYLVKIITKS